MFVVVFACLFVCLFYYPSELHYRSFWTPDSAMGWLFVDGTDTGVA